jgi:hypothetical protein
LDQQATLPKPLKISLQVKKYQPTPRINVGFDHLSGPGFDNKAGSIYEGMNENPNFPNSTPDMATFNTARLAYTNALEKAASRSVDDIAAKDKARTVLTAMLVELGNYVTLTANGDANKLISSRFDMRKQREPKPDMQKPKNLKLWDGINPGVIHVSVDAVPGARSYSHEYTMDPLTPDSVWTVVSSTSRKCTFKNLQSGAKIWVRVAAVGVRNQFNYSDILSRIVQ